MSAPNVNAGNDQTITDAVPLILAAIVTPGTYQLDTTKFLWTQISGPDCTMTHPSGAVNPVY